MNAKAEEVLQEALLLSARERAALADDLLSSLDNPDPQIDQSWIAEAESRIKAETRGEMSTVAVEKVFGKYERR